MKIKSNWNSQLRQINHRATDIEYPSASRTTATTLRVPDVATVKDVVGNEAGKTMKLLPCESLLHDARNEKSRYWNTHPSNIKLGGKVAIRRQYHASPSLS